MARRVLLIGWDAADWQFINPLIERDLMPTLAGLRERGAWGNLATLRPPLSPMLWTSIATGHRPTKHGILGFIEPSPDGCGVRTASSTSRRVKALWNILTQNNLRSNVVGWFATHPAEAINGVIVANNFETPVAPRDQPFPIPPGSIHPPELAQTISDLRVHPAELDAASLLPFVPRAAEIDQSKDPRVKQLAFLLAQTASVHAIATHLIEHTEWDLTAIYYEGIDRAGHHFMAFHPPVSSGVSARAAELYGEVMIGFYRFHDMMLERLLKLAGADTTIVLVSDHGYYHDEHRPDLDAGPLEWHRSLGIACLAGPGIREGARLFGGNVLDVAPSVLSLLGLPAARDMDGRPWNEILSFTAPTPIASWEKIDGNDGQHPPDTRVDPYDASAATAQFVALGYLEAPPNDQQEAAEMAASLAQHNLAIAHLDANEPAAAVPFLQKLHEKNPQDHNLTLQLAIACAANGDGAAARAYAEPLAMPRAWLLLGRIELAERNIEGAMRWFSKAEEESPNDAEVLLRIGQLHLQAKRYAEATRVLNRAAVLRNDLAPTHDGLAEASIALGRPQDGLRHALRATEIAHFFPRAHFHVGQALADMRQFEKAEPALALAVAQAPNFSDAQKTLAEVRRRLGVA